MNRGQVRAVLFDFLAGRLEGKHADRCRAALDTLEMTAPRLRDVLRQAHEGGDRASVNWNTERRAIDELQTIFGWYAVGRLGLRASPDRERATKHAA